MLEVTEGAPAADRRAPTETGPAPVIAKVPKQGWPQVLPPHLCLGSEALLVLKGNFRSAEAATSDQQRQESQDLPGLKKRTLVRMEGLKGPPPQKIRGLRVQLALFSGLGGSRQG